MWLLQFRKFRMLFLSVKEMILKWKLKLIWENPSLGLQKLLPIWMVIKLQLIELVR